ncbi:hypothetical protein ACCO45_005438 [Purpureocillium lilacinum]|uniref:Uncharacterized protein n=1 Tax=Purpureocillium lilacinum TaxID=33203 RepID=A0ACC4DVP0_PURLI
MHPGDGNVVDGGGGGLVKRDLGGVAIFWIIAAFGIGTLIILFYCILKPGIRKRSARRSRGGGRHGGDMPGGVGGVAFAGGHGGGHGGEHGMMDIEMGVPRMPPASRGRHR